MGEETNLFFALYVEGKGAPGKFHNTLEEAKTEATRLAKKEAGKKVYILKSIEYAVAEAPVVFNNVI